MLEVYGIQNCDTCRKTRSWLASMDREFVWHDLRQDGIDVDKIQGWLEAVGPEALVNRRSATWRGLDPSRRQRAMDPGRAAALLAENPTLIKRPVIEDGGTLHVGFTEAVRESL